MNNKVKNTYCYMCNEIATSKEHVPPSCLFPEEKDFKTSIFRNNLLTVPSCDKHNSKKSKDDEFLMACMAGIVGNNIIGFFHAHTKVRRAFERKSKGFVHALMKEAQAFELKNKAGQAIPVLVGRPDYERLESCFRHIAYGLFYNKYQKQFDGTCRILLDFVTYENERTETYKLLCRKRFEVEPAKPKTEGNNPEIFKYQFFEPDEFGRIGMRMAFYKGATVFVAFNRLAQ